MLLSIIILTYNSEKYIFNCLESIEKHNDLGDELEIVIVDNQSSHVDKMFSDISNMFSKIRIKLVVNESNSGYGDGNNVGLKHCNGKIICIMNPDIILIEPVFCDVVKEFKENNRLSMLGYKQIGGKNLSFYIRQEFYIPFITSFITKFFNKINFFDKQYMFLSGAFFFTRKDIFESIGLFDEKLFLYCEESDITKRFLENKYDIKYKKNIHYIHDINKREVFDKTGYRILLDSTNYYLSKYSFNFIYFLKKNKLEQSILFFISKILRNSNSNIYLFQLSLINKFLKNEH